jgi:hypothetical protein
VPIGKIFTAKRNEPLVVHAVAQARQLPNIRSDLIRVFVNRALKQEVEQGTPAR